MIHDYIVGRSRHPLLCRWWLKTRPCPNAIQLGPPDLPPVVEFYVPWWAWPLELMHRAIFGYARIEPIDMHPDWPDQLEAAYRDSAQPLPHEFWERLRTERFNVALAVVIGIIVMLAVMVALFALMGVR